VFFLKTLNFLFIKLLF